MGSFFANLQLRLAERTVSDVVSTIRAHFTAGGEYVEVAEGDKTHRVVLLALPKGSAWLGIYDEAERSDALRELGELLSSPTEPAVGVQVADSDDLALTLYPDGAVVDSHETHVESGDESAWASLLVDGAGPEKLRAALDFHSRQRYQVERNPAALGWIMACYLQGMKALLIIAFFVAPTWGGCAEGDPGNILGSDKTDVSRDGSESKDGWEDKRDVWGSKDGWEDKDAWVDKDVTDRDAIKPGPDVANLPPDLETCCALSDKSWVVLTISECQAQGGVAESPDSERCKKAMADVCCVFEDGSHVLMSWIECSGAGGIDGPLSWCAAN